MAKGIKRCFCNACGRETDHDVVWQDERTVESPSEDLFRIESVIRDHYITGPMLKTAKTLIPPRP